MNTLLSVNYLAIAAAFAITACDVEAGWKTGTTLPSLDKYELVGTIPATAGKVILIDFWASWCAPCKASFPILNELHKRYGDKGLIIVAINVDEQDSAMTKFLAAHPAAFTVVHDARHALAQAAEPQSMPSSFIIDRAGVIRFAHSGFHGAKTAKAYEEEIESLLKETR